MQQALEIDSYFPFRFLRVVSDVDCHYVSAVVGLANGRVHCHIVWMGLSKVFKPGVYLSQVVLNQIRANDPSIIRLKIWLCMK